MKTAEEKAIRMVRRFSSDTGAIGMDGKFTEQLREIISMGLKEQDRDTRHACAEACLLQADRPALEMIDACHNSCMNVRAV